MASWSSSLTVALFAVVAWACSSKGSAPSEAGGGTAGVSGGSANTGGSSGPGGSGSNGGSSASSNTVASGAVQNGGPPCKPIYGASLADRSDVETLVTLTSTMIDDGFVVNQYGVFWGISGAIQTKPLAGGNISTMLTGAYTLIGTVGSDLLIANSDASSTVPTVYSRIPATSAGGNPTAILTLSSTESLMTFDDQYLYLYDSASTSIERAALSDGARSVVESAVTRKSNESSAYGGYLYYENDVYIRRVPIAGGTSENFYYNFDLWTFNIVEGELFVSTFSTINAAPLSNPNSMASLASVPSGMLTSYIDWMTLSGGRVYYLDSNDGFGWVNLQGTRCEGLFIEDMFFGTILVFDGYVYIKDDLTIRRVRLPV